MQKSMLARQRGALKLHWVAICAALLAAVAMTLLMSMRTERNLFADIGDKAVRAFKASPAQDVLNSARHVAAGTSGQMKKCVIDGKTVISNTECVETNPTTKEIKIQMTRGVEAPREPPKPIEERGSDPLVDKIIEKSLR